MTSLILYGLLNLLGTFLLTVIACLVILPICANARLTPFERLGQVTYVLTIAGLLIYCHRYHSLPSHSSNQG